MKQHGLLLLTASALLLTVVVLARAAASRPVDAAAAARPRNPFSGETAIRYRQSQPSHWRAFLLRN
jgi:hypothetical protein